MDSCVFTWPDAGTVDAALREWTADAATRRPELVRVGYLGSYARGDWGVGSDLDVVIVVKGSEIPFLERARAWDLTRLPVPADAIVYTVQEIAELSERGGRFATTLRDEAAGSTRRLRRTCLAATPLLLPWGLTQV